MGGRPGTETGTGRAWEPSPNVLTFLRSQTVGADIVWSVRCPRLTATNSAEREPRRTLSAERHHFADPLAELNPFRVADGSRKCRGLVKISRCVLRHVGIRRKRDGHRMLAETSEQRYRWIHLRCWLVQAGCRHLNGHTSPRSSDREFLVEIRRCAVNTQILLLDDISVRQYVEQARVVDP